MFDIGFWEIALITLIALMILGPERLPRAARSLGVYMGKARRMLAEVKRDIDRELDAADMKQLKEIKEEVQETVQDSKKMFEEASIKQDLDEAKAELEETASVLNEKIDEKSESEPVVESPNPEPEIASETAKPKKASTTPPKKAKKPQPVAKEPSVAVDESKTVA